MMPEDPIAQLEAFPIHYILLPVADKYLCTPGETLSLKIGSCPAINLFGTIIHVRTVY